MVVTTVRSLVTSLLNVLIFKKIKKNESFQKNNFIRKFKKSPNETWEELDNEGEDEKANLALMASTFSDSESEADSDFESEDTKQVFSSLSKSHLNTMCHDLMG